MKAHLQNKKSNHLIIRLFIFLLPFLSGLQGNATNPESSIYQRFQTINMVDILLTPLTDSLEIDSLALDSLQENDPIQLSAFPNPFNTELTIQFEIQRSEYVRIDLFDRRGNWILTVFEGAPESGRIHTLLFDSSKLKPDVYISRIMTEDQARSKMLILK